MSLEAISVFFRHPVLACAAKLLGQLLGVFLCQADGSWLQCALSLLWNGPRLSTCGKSESTLTHWIPLGPCCWLSEVLPNPILVPSKALSVTKLYKPVAGGRKPQGALHHLLSYSRSGTWDVWPHFIAWPLPHTSKSNTDNHQLWITF